MASQYRPTRRLCGLPFVVAAWLAAAPGWAQTPLPVADTQLAPVVVTGRATPVATLTGWGDLPVAGQPLQASVFSAEQFKDKGAQRLSDLVGFDAAVGDAYNAEGYWDYLTVRGFVIDNRFNFRRDGLPINAETSIPLDNKAQVEVLKGTSGMQAGTSAPGGLVNLVVKRPLAAPLRHATLEWREAGSATAAVDLSQRFGVAEAFGVRVNVAAATLDPPVHDARGQRRLLAIAGDWRVAPDTLIEAEFETSHRSQPSVPGFSLLGDRVPGPPDPRINLNNQPWSLPVALNASTASLRWQQSLAAGWRVTAHAATQRLRSDDRIAFPFGCFAPEPAPGGTYYADRYCPDGSFDLYDFRSENERRRTDALDASLHGRAQTGPLEHRLTAGVLRSTVRNRFQRQAFNYAGPGRVDGTAVTPAAPDLAYQSTDRDERSTEFYLRDAVPLTERLTAWLGLRHTRLHRQSVGTDGVGGTDYRQSLNTPFAAISYSLAPRQTLYLSWGRGLESEVVPNRPRYLNAGLPLATLESRQTEIGFKGSHGAAEWAAAAFDIVRPLFADIGACNGDSTCTRQADGQVRHRGVELNGSTRLAAWTLRGGGQWLHARRIGGSDTRLNGLAPTNVPARSVRLQVEHRPAALPGLTWLAGVVAESHRAVLPDNSIGIPGFARADLALRYERRSGAQWIVWRVGIDNLADRRAWRESPYQFGHAYLFPLAPRTLRASVAVDI